MFEYDFMQNVFMAAAIVAVVAGPVGYFLVLRGLCAGACRLPL